MAITNFTELKSSLQSFSDRSDTEVTDVLDDFIALAEAHFNRELRLNDSLTKTNLTADERAESLPSDFNEMYKVYISGGSGRPIDFLPLNTFLDTYLLETTGTICNYTIKGSDIWLGPIPAQSTTVSLLYYAKIPALSDGNPTNFLLTNYPDLYLYRCLAHLFEYLGDSQSASRNYALAEDMLNRVIKDDKRRAFNLVDGGFATAKAQKPRGL